MNEMLNASSVKKDSEDIWNWNMINSFFLFVDHFIFLLDFSTSEVYGSLNSLF